jgi:hypothetical protein
MLYKKANADKRIRPFHDDDVGYIFRFFCEAEKAPYVPAEQALPKCKPEYICPCGAPMRVQTDEVGPYLDSTDGQHFGAEECVEADPRQAINPASSGADPS